MGAVVVMEPCKIYLLTNDVNRKLYVGQSWYPFERERAILQTYLDNKLGIKKIAEQFQCGLSAIYRILERNGVGRRIRKSNSNGETQ